MRSRVRDDVQSNHPSSTIAQRAPTRKLRDLRVRLNQTFQPNPVPARNFPLQSINSSRAQHGRAVLFKSQRERALPDAQIIARPDLRRHGRVRTETANRYLQKPNIGASVDEIRCVFIQCRRGAAREHHDQLFVFIPLHHAVRVRRDVGVRIVDVPHHTTPAAANLAIGRDNGDARDAFRRLCEHSGRRRFVDERRARGANEAGREQGRDERITST